MSENPGTKTLEDIPEPFLKYIEVEQEDAKISSASAKSDNNDDLLFAMLLILIFCNE